MKKKIATLIIGVALLAGCGSSEETKKEEPPEIFNGGRANYYSILTDSETGCQYIEVIEYSNGAGASLTPRLDSDGKLICKK